MTQIHSAEVDTAFHEAGHAVIALLTGMLIDFVTITSPSNNTTGRVGNTRVIPTSRSFSKLSFLAGIAVDKKRQVSDVTPEEDDPTRFILRTGHFYGNTDISAVLDFYVGDRIPLEQWTHNVRVLRLQAAEMIAKPEVWLKIETVAQLLIERKTLRCEDIYEIVVGRALSVEQLNLVNKFRATQSPVLNKGNYPTGART